MECERALAYRHPDRARRSHRAGRPEALARPARDAVTAAAPTPERGALAGLRVVECGGGVAAAYAAKLLADLGAEVVKVEPPEGDYTRLRGPFPGTVPNREASGLFIYLNAGKQSVVLDLATPDGEWGLDQLLQDADILVHNFTPHAAARRAVEPERLLAKHPRLVVADITGFGRSGPH